MINWPLNLCGSAPFQAMLQFGTSLKKSFVFRIELMTKEDSRLRFCDSKGGVRKCRLMSDFSTIDQVWIHRQQSCSYGSQINVFCLFSIEFATVCPCFDNLRVMSRDSCFGFLVLFLKPRIALQDLRTSLSCGNFLTETALFCWNCLVGLKSVFGYPQPSFEFKNMEGFHLFSGPRQLSMCKFSVLDACESVASRLSIDEFVGLHLFGMSAQNDWGLNIFMNYAPKFWVVAYALSRHCEALLGLYLDLTVSFWFWILLSKVQLCSGTCYPGLLNFAISPMSLYFVPTCG